MSRYRSDPEMLENLEPTACGNFLHYSWKTVTCLFSHVTLVTLVVSYCILGAFTFEKLEVQREKDVKMNISNIRKNVTNELWKLTDQAVYLKQENFTKDVKVILKEFESSLMHAIDKEGWNGEEEQDKVQWTFTGALFYSIIVITTIGYGHIAPKTTWGKVVTIFYAILGIPLMLLCLSNIGDVMATSFRFLYWKVCCYMCNKPKKTKRRGRGGTFKVAETKSMYRPRGSFRRSVRTSTRSADSGFGRSEIGQTSHSDTELRYHDETDSPGPRRGQSLPRMRTPQYKNSDNNRKRNTFPNPKKQIQGGSLDRRILSNHETALDLDPILVANTPVFCNKYVAEDFNIGQNHVSGNRKKEEGFARSPMAGRRAISMPRTPTYLQPPRDPSPTDSSREDLDSYKVTTRKKKQNPLPPKMMTPLGYGHRSKYLDDADSDEDYYEDGYYDSGRVKNKPVPIWLCVFLVVGYIIAGAFLFQYWENWGFLNSAYFCFVTLTTIGFGDFVPAKGVKENAKAGTISIALCSLYLLFGISLLAMSFNLVQEEVIANVKSVAKTLGIIKSEETETESEED